MRTCDVPFQRMGRGKMDARSGARVTDAPGTASVDESLIHEGLELGRHPRATATHLLDHEDAHEVLLAVDEEVRARGAGPAEHTRGGEVAGLRRVDEDAYAEPISFAARGAAARGAARD